MPKWLGRSKADKEKKKLEKESKSGSDIKQIPRKPSSSSLSPTHQHIAVYGADNKLHVSPGSSSGGVAATRDSSSPSPSDSSQDIGKRLVPSNDKSSIPRRESGTKVAAHKAFYEGLHGSTSPRPSTSPEKKAKDFSESAMSSSSNTSSRISVSVTSPTSRASTTAQSSPKAVTGYTTSSSPTIPRRDFDSPIGLGTEVSRDKDFAGVDLPLPPLQMTPVRLREVDAMRSMHSGGFGFILRKSYLPSPEEPDKTKLVHLIEPRPDYNGPLMTGDRIIEVNGEDVEDAPHEAVVEMIKASGDCVNLKVASMPELLELNARGALDNPQDNPLERSSVFRRSGKAKQGTGELTLEHSCYCCCCCCCC